MEEPMQRILIVFFMSFIVSATSLLAHFDDEHEYREPIKQIKIDKKSLEKIIADGHNSNFTFKAEAREDIMISGFKFFETLKSISDEDQKKIFATLSFKVEPAGSSLEVTTNENRDDAEDVGGEINNYGFSFKILLPEKMNIEAETHNGYIRTDGGAFSALDITTHNGSQAYNAQRFEKLEAETHNGSITVSKTTIPDATITTHNGSLKIKECTITSLDINSQNGEVKLEKTKFTKAKIDGHNGDIVLKDTEGTLTAEDHNGRFEGRNVLFTGDSEVISHNGDITINFDSRNQLKITATSEHGFPFQDQNITKKFQMTENGESFFIVLGKPHNVLALQTNNGEISLKK